MDVIVACKKRLAPKHLPKNAPHAPNVDGLVVVLHGEHDFRSAIPTGNHVPDGRGQGQITNKNEIKNELQCTGGN